MRKKLPKPRTAENGFATTYEPHKLAFFAPIERVILNRIEDFGENYHEHEAHDAARRLGGTAEYTLRLGQG